MLFNSFIFLVFLLVVLPLFYYTKKEHRNLLVLISSYIFYGYWDWRFCFLLAISTVVDYFIGQRLHAADDEKTRKRFLLFSMCVNLGILAVFKYFNFFIDSFDAVAGMFGGNLDFLHLHIILPVGISFYTFQTMSYTIDIYRRRLEPTTNFIDFALFVSFFPQLVAGPIERASNLLPQIAKGLNPTKEQMQAGINLIIIGMFKKVMIGDACGRIVDHVFAQPEYYSSPELIMGLVLFSIQIYADFSGYSSIARGTSKLLGIELMKNFEQPYLSSNITEFWRRWHISLSSWLKDYLYISLGGNRKGKNRTYVNLMLTMLLGGLWHGASWNFVIWGGLHGIYLAVHKLTLGKNKPQVSYTYDNAKGFILYVSKVLATYLLVLFTWLFFRAHTFGDATAFLEGIFIWEGSPLAMRCFTISFGFMAMTILLDIIMYYTKDHTFMRRVQSVPARWGILSGMMLITMIYMFVEEPLPFVYFQF
ncbi:MAG: MBOAT family O-acyltransferase [Bacteroidota bacterium]